MKNKIKMNTDNVHINGSQRYVDQGDLVDFLKNHLDTYLYSQKSIEKPLESKPDKTFNSNILFWQSVLGNECYPEQVIKLEGFHLIEWIPIAPGLFHTSEALWNRREAQRNAVRLLEENSVGPTWRPSILNVASFEGNPLFKNILNTLKTNPNKKVVIEYNPDGKESMIKGGIGSVRLASKLINGSEKYILGATSTGVSHEGIPLIVETVLYQEAISKIKENGGFNVNLIGRLKIIPKDLSIIKSYNEIPRFCLYVEKIEFNNPSNREDLMSSIAVSYYSSNSFANKRLSFCSFTPDKKDSELVGAVNWLQEYAIKYSSSKTPIVEGDFDEFKQHFDHVDFPIVDVSNGKMSKETFLKYKEFFHFQINEMVMGDKFENIQNSTIVNRSESVAINSTEDKKTNTDTPEIQQLKKTFQDLVANGQVEEALEKLLDEFKKRDNKYALNEAIMYNAQFAQLKAQQNFNTISHDDANRENARITKAIIDFIERVV
jgi:hypothetical protein